MKDHSTAIKSFVAVELVVEGALETYSSIKSWRWQSKEQTRIHLVMRPAVRFTCHISCKESRKPQQSRSQPRQKPMFFREFRTKLLRDQSFHRPRQREREWQQNPNKDVCPNSGTPHDKVLNDQPRQPVRFGKMESEMIDYILTCSHCSLDLKL